MKYSVVAGLVIIVAAIAGYIVQQSYSVALVDQTPMSSAAATQVEFTLPDLDGIDRRLAEWDGEPRLINFWATWCAPCRREIPLLMRLQSEKTENRIQVIGIAVDFLDDVRAYAAETRFNYPILVGQEEAIAIAESTGVEFIGLPFTLIVASDGTLVSTHMGEIMQQHIDHIVEVMRDLDNGNLGLNAARDALSDF